MQIVATEEGPTFATRLVPFARVMVISQVSFMKKPFVVPAGARRVARRVEYFNSKTESGGPFFVPSVFI